LPLGVLLRITSSSFIVHTVMKIVIDCRALYKNIFTEHYSCYIIDALFYLQKAKPQVEFFFLTDKIPTDILHQNLIIKKSLPGLAGWKIWYQRQVPAILKNVKADILITTGIASSFIDIPQCIWIPGIEKDNYFKKKYFEWIQKKLQETLKNAKIIFVNSEKNKKTLVADGSYTHNKIILIPPVADETCYPLTWEEREEIKKVYTKGREYFLVTQHDFLLPGLINLMKAFSQFKKRQQSNMQLVITDLNEKKKFSDKLEGFKYRADVHLYDHLDEVAFKKISSAAYGLLQPIAQDVALLNSFTMHVPVITNVEGYPEEMDKNAVLYASFTDIEELADRMMLLYKDEGLRNAMIENGRNIIKQFSRKQQLTKLWEGLVNAFNH